MSVTNALQGELFSGIEHGRREALAEAPVYEKVAGIKNPNYRALKMPIRVADLPYPTLGVTNITPDGDVTGVTINRKIPELVEKARNTYNRSHQWAKEKVYNMAKLVTEHELAHAHTSRVAKGKKFNKYLVNVMESLTTYAKMKTAKALGKYAKAEEIERSNPYPAAWRLGQIADWAPYKSESGSGHSAFIQDFEKEPYKASWRLAKVAAKSALNKGKNYLGGTGVPQYAMHAA